MDKDLNTPNPKLEKGDRIILIYMQGEEIPIETKGIVKNKLPQPSFSSSDLSFGYAYEVDWYNDDGKKVSTLSLLPEADLWIYDREYYENN